MVPFPAGRRITEYWLGVQGLDQGASLVRRSAYRAIVGNDSDTT